MVFSMLPLLIHSPAVPPNAREALRAASAAPVEQRRAALESAARVVFLETDLECREVRDMVGLESAGACS